MKKFDKYERFGAYHWAAYENDPEYRAHVDHVCKWVTGDSVLDVGAGDGLICSKLGAGAVGIDSDETAVKLAKQKGVNVSMQNAESIQCDDASFDAVYFGDVIEHLETPEKALSEIHRVLTDDGKLYVVWPTPGIRDEYANREYTVKALISLVESWGFRLMMEARAIKSRTYAVFAKQINYANTTQKQTPRVGRGKKAV